MLRVVMAEEVVVVQEGLEGMAKCRHDWRSCTNDLYERDTQ